MQAILFCFKDMIFNRVFKKKNPVIDMMKKAGLWQQNGTLSVQITPPYSFQKGSSCFADQLYIY